jgi:general secretion pathway protein K
MLGLFASSALRQRARTPIRQRGFALVAVLWLILALALLGGAFLRQARGHSRLALTQLESARAEALADAGVERAKLALLAVDPASAWRADGRPYALAIDGGTVTVSLQDEAGKIDLNRAGEAVLQGLFQQAGRSPTAAQALADAVADFRDADDDRRPNGAEAADYAAAGESFTAKNAAFATTDELRHVLGMDDALFRQVAPYVTVDSPRRTVNPATASALVLRALPNLESGQVDALLEARTTDDPSALALGITTATIRADAVTAGGGRFIREAIIRRTTDPLRPFDVLSWRQRWPEDAAGDGDPPPAGPSGN